MYSCETMGKGACIKRMVAVSNYSKNIIIEKTNLRRKGGGRVKDMESCGVK